MIKYQYTIGRKCFALCRIVAVNPGIAEKLENFMKNGRFLLELAPFEKFDTELAKMVSGDLHAGELLSQIRQNTCMLQINGLDEFHFRPIFRDFLMWKQESEYTVEQQRALYSRGGLYFEPHENYAKALEYYSKSSDRAKVSELLIKTINMHPGMGHYEDLEQYFFSLSDA